MKLTRGQSDTHQEPDVSVVSRSSCSKILKDYGFPLVFGFWTVGQEFIFTFISQRKKTCRLTDDENNVFAALTNN